MCIEKFNLIERVAVIFFEYTDYLISTSPEIRPSKNFPVLNLFIMLHTMLFY